MVENETDRKLKCLQSDNEGEYKYDEFLIFSDNVALDRNSKHHTVRSKTESQSE